MKLYDIKDRSLKLNKYPLPRGGRLPEKTLRTYYGHIYHTFNKLFSAFRPRPVLIQSLIQILQNNWDLIKSTNLSYTNLPDDEITTIMVGVAAFLAKEPGIDEHPLKLLMPGVYFETCDDSHPDLLTEPNKLDVNILNILKTHILGQDALYLVPIKILTELELRPDNPPIYNPYFDYSTMSAHQAVINADELYRLYNHSKLTLNLDKKIKSYEAIANNEKHLLGQLRKLCQSLKMGSRYGEGSEMEAGQSAYQGVIRFMQFYNALFGRKLFILKSLPLKYEAFQNCFIHYKSNLYYVSETLELTHIPIREPETYKKLLKEIILNKPLEDDNSVILNAQDMHYLIDNLSDFSSIDPQIPASLKLELIKLFDFTTNPNLNEQGTANTGTCVANLRQSLITYMTPVENLLQEYTIDVGEPEINHETIEGVRAAQTALSTALTNKTYIHGQDKLENYDRLLQPLLISFSVPTHFDLNVLLGYYPDTIKGLLAHENIRESIIELFPSASDLIGYIIDLSNSQLKVFFQHLKQDLSVSLIKDIDDFCEVSRYFDAERFTIIASEMAAQTIKSIPDFIKLSQELDLPVFRMLCAHLKSHLMQKLDIEQFILACTAFKASRKIDYWLEVFLKSMLELPIDAKTYLQLLPFISQAQSEELFQKYKKEFIHTTETLDIFLKLLAAIDVSKRPWYFKKTVAKFELFIQDTDDLKILIKALDEDNFLKYYSYLAPFISSLNLSLSQFADVLSEVPQEFCSQFIEINKNYIFPLFLKSGDHSCMEGFKEHMMDYFKLKDIHMKLKQLCSAQYSLDFISSFVIDESASPHKKFHQLFTPIHGDGFFKQVADPAPILHIIVSSMPRPYLKTLFNALYMKFVKNPQLQQDLLMKYLRENFETKPIIKRFKVGA